MKTIICLIRHGQTDWNKELLIQGTIDNPLNDTGRKQAQEAGQRILQRGLTFDVYLSSPLSRAYDTMEEIKKVLGVKSNTISFSKVIEREFGELEGKKVCTENYKLMDDGLVKGLELLPDLQQRSIKALKEIANTYPGKKVLVTTHSQVIKGALSFLLSDFDFKCVVSNGSLNIFEVENDVIIPIEYNK